MDNIPVITATPCNSGSIKDFEEEVLVPSCRCFSDITEPPYCRWDVLCTRHTSLSEPAVTMGTRGGGVGGL